MTRVAPSTLTVDKLLDRVEKTLAEAEVIAPFTLTVGAGFSHGIIPGSRDVIDRMAPAAKGEPAKFWTHVNNQLAEGSKVELTEAGVPNLSTPDLLYNAYG